MSTAFNAELILGILAIIHSYIPIIFFGCNHKHMKIYKINTYSNFSFLLYQ